MNEWPMDINTYIALMVSLGGKTKEEATRIARALYVEQHGKTPEEHQKEIDAFDWSNWGKTKTVSFKKD